MGAAGVRGGIEGRGSSTADERFVSEKWLFNYGDNVGFDDAPIGGQQAQPVHAGGGDNHTRSAGSRNAAPREETSLAISIVSGRIRNTGLASNSLNTSSADPHCFAPTDDLVKYPRLVPRKPFGIGKPANQDMSVQQEPWSQG
jgi:hypothetical protein